MNTEITSVFRNALEVYEYLCRPVCKEMDIQMGELNILLFLDKNPEHNTVMDIHKGGGMKASMVSIQVEKLVQKGYLERQAVPEDRRKVKLVVTEKAAPVIAAGNEAKIKIMHHMGAGITPEDGEVFARVLSTLAENIMRCREQMVKGELK